MRKLILRAALTAAIPLGCMNLQAAEPTHGGTLNVVVQPGTPQPDDRYLLQCSDTTGRG